MIRQAGGTPLWLRRLLHLHSPSLVTLGADPIVSPRRARTCKVCADALAPPPTPEESLAMILRAGARQHALMCDDDDCPHRTD